MLLNFVCFYINKFSKFKDDFEKENFEYNILYDDLLKRNKCLNFIVINLYLIFLSKKFFNS